MYAICASCNNYIQFTAADVVFPDFRPVSPPLHLLSGGAVLKGVGFVSFREASSLDRATADMLPFKSCGVQENLLGSYQGRGLLAYRLVVASATRDQTGYGM